MWTDYLTALGVPWKRRGPDLALTGRPLAQFAQSFKPVLAFPESRLHSPHPAFDRNGYFLLLPDDGPDYYAFGVLVSKLDPNGIDVGLLPNGQLCGADDPRWNPAALTFKWLETVAAKEYRP